MTDLNKIARELLAAEFVKEGYSSGTAEDMALDGVRLPAIRAIRTALLAAPPGYVLVPVEVTKDMRNAWDSAPDNEDDDIAFWGAYRAMLAAAPEVK